MPRRSMEFMALLIVALGLWLGFAGAGLPPVTPASAPPAAFSAQRAAVDLQFIAARPHPVGTGAHDALRDYLVDRLRVLGVADVHVQSATGFNTLDGPIAATVANVVGRKRGMHAGPALLLTAHYDAVPRSFGAGDDGAGVAAILETLRALAAGPPLDHDLIVVLSDAEEDGLLGAEAFVDLHPWARQVGVVLNFEGRGDAGPVYMFQTSPGNDALIDAIAAGVPDARTNSLTGEVYRHLPSDTDMSIWLHSAFAVGALNFADIGGYPRYHTPMDNLADLDLRIVQQMGEYALGLTRSIDAGTLVAPRRRDAIYFNAPWLGVMHYPAQWAFWLSLLTLAAVTAVLVTAARRGQLTRAGVICGALVLLLAVVVPAVVTSFAWRLILLVHPAYAEILQRDPYNSLWYLLAFSLFTVALIVTAQRRLESRATPLELAAAPLAVWAAIGLLLPVTLPGATYTICWPLLGTTAAAGLWLFDRSGKRHAPSVLLTAMIALGALPALIIWPPLIESFEIALTAHQLAFCEVLVALVVSLLVMPLSRIAAMRRWLAIGAALAGLVVLIRAETTAGFSDQRKRPDSLMYLGDADAGHAWWISADQKPDAWTRLALGTDPARRSFDETRLGAPGVAFMASKASGAATSPARIELLDDDATTGGRRIHLHVDRSGDGEELALYLDGGGPVTDVTINGRLLRDGNRDRYLPEYHIGGRGTLLRYFGVPEGGVDLWFSLAGRDAISLRVVTAVEGLPPTAAGPLPPRPADLMSKPFIPTDMTIVEQVIRL